MNKLRVAGLIEQGINPYFESLFETGVDEMSWDDLSKNKMAWPSVKEVKGYRRQVYHLVKQVIANASDDAIRHIDQSSPYWSIVLGIEHERIHIETSSVLITELPLKHLQKPYFFPPYHGSIPEESAKMPVAGKDFPKNEMIAVPEMEVHLGKDQKKVPSYGWDNEYGSKAVTVPAFKCSQFQISNGEYYEFVVDGGYANVEYWTEVGWGWRAFRNAKHPTFWVRTGPQGLHQYKLRCLFDEVEMPWSWPVSVNFHEAVAFSNWKSKKTGKKIRVLTEPEFHAINPTDFDPVLDSRANDMARHFGINANLGFSSQVPVNHGKPNAMGFSGVMGNAWEWCMDYFCALPGFAVHPYYEDFSTPCFDGLHNIIKGGSFISTGNEASVYSRFHFRPHFHQHSSFRVVEQLSDSVITSDLDAPGPFVGEYPFRRSTAGMMKEIAEGKAPSRISPILAQFGKVSRKFSLPAAKSLGDLIVENMSSMKLIKNANILEVGCGVGSLSLQLAEHANRVIGVDHSADNIATALSITQGTFSTDSVDDDDRALLDLPSKLKSPSSQVDFRACDPMCLPAEFVNFDVVVINNILDKVSAPNSILGRLAGPRGVLREGGLLVVSTSYNWNENITPKSLWIDDAEKLRSRLMNDFEYVSGVELPVYWPESSREIRGALMDVLVFKRK